MLKTPPPLCRYSWPTLVINSSWFDNVLRGFSGLAKAQHCSPSLSHRFYITVGIEQVPERSGSHVNSPSFPHSLLRSHTNTYMPFPLFRALRFTLLWVRKADLQIQPVKREEIQAANELTPSLCLHHDDMPVHVFVCWVKLLASVHPSCQWASEHYVNVSLFPFLKNFCVISLEVMRAKSLAVILLGKTMTVCLNWHFYCLVVCH